MINHTRKKIVQGVLLALVFILGMSGTSQGAEFWLRAETMLKSMPSTSDITMWGFAQCTDGTYTVCDPATVPGPRLTVPVGDPVLTINLRNNLTGPFVEPVSIVIPGQTITPTPVRNPDGRVRSFTTETPPDNSTTVVYSWTNMKPGTYLYESGTHPAVQVQMGLYGAVTKDFAAGQAYGATTAYASEAILLFSEIDPLLHGHVAAGTYGTPPPTGITSTMIYEPKYFLINGAPYTASSVPLPAGTAGTNVLLRFLNAGLKQRAPVIQGLYFSLVAEDGNAYGYAKQQYSMLLPAGKTIDAIIRPASYGNFAIYDRRLGLTNGAASGGGMLVYLTVAPAAPTRIGVYDGTSSWYLDANGNGSWEGPPTDKFVYFGLAGAKAVVGDWNGSGTTKVAVYDNGMWYVDYNGNGAWDGTPTDQIYFFGLASSISVAGDWKGIGTTQIGTYSSGTWYIDYNGNGLWDGTPGDVTYTFDAGQADAIPVTGDWDGNGSDGIGVYKDGIWYVDYNGNGVWDGQPGDRIYAFGYAGALPVTGDWTGTGTSKLGVYDPATQLWYLDADGDGVWDGTPTDIMLYFGIPGAVPLSGIW